MMTSPLPIPRNRASQNDGVAEQLHATAGAAGGVLSRSVDSFSVRAGNGVGNNFTEINRPKNLRRPGIHFMQIIPLLLLVLLCGCASVPVVKRTATVMKPKSAPKAVKRKAPMPPMPAGMLEAMKATATFQPAAVVPAPLNTNAFIFAPGHPQNPFTNVHLVGFWQSNNTILEMQYADVLGSEHLWNFLALYGSTPTAQYVAAVIPDNWQPHGRLFVRDRQEVVAPGFALAANRSKVTGKYVTVFGRKYQLRQIGSQGAEFQLYHLQPIPIIK